MLRHKYIACLVPVYGRKKAKSEVSQISSLCTKRSSANTKIVLTKLFGTSSHTKVQIRTARRGCRKNTRVCFRVIKLELWDLLSLVLVAVLE